MNTETEKDEELKKRREAAQRILEFHKYKWNYGDVLAYLDKREKESEERYRKRKEFEERKKQTFNAHEIRTSEDEKEIQIMTTENDIDEKLEKRKAAKRLKESWKEAFESGRFAYEIGVLEQEERKREERYRQRKESEEWKKQRVTANQTRQSNN